MKTVIGNAELWHGDCLEVMRGMESNSVDAIITDPPYFKVKGETWDNQWDNPSSFLEWVGVLCEQFERILKPNGSIYFFASPQMGARVEVEIRKRFNVLNNITWRKGESGKNSEGRGRRANKESLRAFFPDSERIIFAEHYQSDSMAKGEAGYAAKCDELHGFVFEPLRAYLVGEFERAGMNNTQGKIAANVACGFSATSGGMASRHYFSQSQWGLPTEEHYAAMRRLLNKNQNEYLRREYEDLRREYEYLRRPFSVTPDVQYGDVWQFAPVMHYKGKHPCEKPQALLRHILSASTKPGAIVFDPFMGGGSMGEACMSMSRKFIGAELCGENYNKSLYRITESAKTCPASPHAIQILKRLNERTNAQI